MKIMVGLSGGVDSSVAALLLQRQGHEVNAMFMHNWDDPDGTSSACQADEDRKDATRIAGQLGIPIHIRDFSKNYWDDVFRHFLDEYAAGRTPNPDVLCNREIKFKTFLQAAIDLGAECIATGHYARIREREGRYQLLRSRDPGKDQSYFLHTLGQQQLARVHFPIGALHKPEVRDLARQAGFATHDKKDSTGVCFIGERNFRQFLSHYLPARPGPILDTRGRTLGEHPGALYFTLGQRQGLGLGGIQGADQTPWYVVDKDVARNTLVVAQGDAGRWLDARRLHASQLSWVTEAPPGEIFSCTAKTRYRQPDQSCRVQIMENHCEVIFEQAQRAPTPGQAVVFYAEELCLGGATIEATDAAFGGLEPCT